MTDEEAIEFYLSRFSLKIWQRLTFFVSLFVFGWWFMTPLFWAISPTFTDNAFIFIAPMFLISVIVWSITTVPKHFLILLELKKLGYKKWRLLQWNPSLIKRSFQMLLPTESERLNYPWLFPVSLGALIFPVVGFVVFIMSFVV